MNEKRTYGLLIEDGIRSYGARFVDVSVIVRQGDKEHPYNPSSTGEDTFDSAPRHLEGLMLCGFGMFGMFSDKDAVFFAYEPQFRDAHRISARDVECMARTFKRWQKQAAADDPREAGDVFMSLVRAFRLDFAVHRAGGGSSAGRMYSENTWRFCKPTEGRDYFRRLIEKTREEQLGKATAA